MRADTMVNVCKKYINKKKFEHFDFDLNLFFSIINKRTLFRFTIKPIKLINTEHC